MDEEGRWVGRLWYESLFMSIWSEIWWKRACIEGGVSRRQPSPVIQTRRERRTIHLANYQTLLPHTNAERTNTQSHLSCTYVFLFPSLSHTQPHTIITTTIPSHNTSYHQPTSIHQHLSPYQSTFNPPTTLTSTTQQTNQLTNLPPLYSR